MLSVVIYPLKIIANHSTMKKYRNLLLCVYFALAGCAASASHPPSSSAAAGISQENEEGYSILYKLMSDEARVGGIFFIKKADESISVPIKQLSLACQAAKKRLEDFRAADNRLHLDMPDLPYIEQRSRDLEASDDRKLLLFSKGKTFELNLLFTQAQATGYASELCRALAENETDAQRKAFLLDLQEQFSAYHERLMKLLSVNS
jgi:hypothetical protein